MPIRSCRTFEDNAILKHDSDTFNNHDPLRIKFRPSPHTLFRSFRVDTKLVIVEEQKAFWKVVLSGSPLLWQEVSCCLILLTLFPYSAFWFIRLVKDCTSRFNKIPRVHESGAVNHIISSILESYGGDGALSFIECFGLIYKCGLNLILGWIDDNRSDIQAFSLICRITVILYCIVYIVNIPIAFHFSLLIHTL